MGVVNRFEVYLIALDPTLGREIKKTRPCVILSPNEMNILDNYIVAPMTTKSKPFPTRVSLTFAGKDGFIVLDQIRTIDKARLIKKLGHIDSNVSNKALGILRQMFEF